MRVRDGDPTELRIGGYQLIKHIAQSARPVPVGRGAQDTPGGANGIQPRDERLTEIRAQLIRFEGKAPHVLFKDTLARDAADPDRGRNGEGDRQSDDQPHGAHDQAAPRIEGAKHRLQPAGNYPIGHGGTLTGD